eukprot:scaffold90447_cov51-Phaeocystis_antarctica.AAC.2
MVSTIDARCSCVLLRLVSRSGASLVAVDSSASCARRWVGGLSSGGARGTAACDTPAHGDTSRRLARTPARPAASGWPP